MYDEWFVVLMIRRPGTLMSACFSASSIRCSFVSLVSSCISPTAIKFRFSMNSRLKFSSPKDALTPVMSVGCAMSKSFLTTFGSELRL